jgi:hypothetical protein
MAKAHTDAGATNPDVRFERTDVDIGPVVKGGAYLFGVLSLAAVLAGWLAWYVTMRERPLKETDLPPAADEVQSVRRPDGSQEKTVGTTLPPSPRLEAIDDVRERDSKNFVLYPPRAEEIYKSERKKAEDRKAVDAALAAKDRLFPVRKDGADEARKAPTNFGVALPSKSSAGRKTTGGQ